VNQDAPQEMASEESMRGLQAIKIIVCERADERDDDADDRDVVE
jgi:hypothetical protein